MTKGLLRRLALLASLALITAACGFIGGDDGDDTSPAEDEGGAVDDSTGVDDSPDDAVAIDGEVADTGEDTNGGETAPTTTVAPGPAVSAYSGAELSGLRVVDDTTFTVTLIEADPDFPDRLAHIGFAPLPSTFFDDPVAFEEAPIGNGPFMMDGSWNHDTSIRLVPNSSYAGRVPASLTSLTFNIHDGVCDEGYLHAQAGFADVSECVPVDQLAFVFDDFGSGFDQSSAASLHYYAFPAYLWDQYPLLLRQALSMAIDRQAIVDEILFGAVAPADRVVPPVLSDAEGPSCANWVHDPDAAEAAFETYGGLEALGETPIVLWHGTDRVEALIAAAIADQLDDVLDISNVVIESRASSEYLDLLDDQQATGPTQAVWSASGLSAAGFLEPIFGSTSSSNSTGYSNARVDQMISAGNIEAAEAGLCGDVAIVPLYFDSNRYVSNLSVNNVFKDVFGRMNWAEMTGGDIVSALGEPQRLIPPEAKESEGIEVLETLFSNLAEYDHRSRRLGNVVAESIESTDDGLTWTITVAQGWTFHDGERVSAYSFVDAWNWTANGENAAANNVHFNVIEGWEAVNG